MDKCHLTPVGWSTSGLPTASLGSIQVPEIDVKEAKGLGWMLVKGLLVVLQVPCSKCQPEECAKRSNIEADRAGPSMVRMCVSADPIFRRS